MKCVACGSAALVEGTLIDGADSGTSRFVPKELSIWEGLRSNVLFPAIAKNIF